MTGLRVAHRLGREATTRPCARCLDFVVLAAGECYAVDTAGLERPVCDRCASTDDPDGFAQLDAWRRASRPTAGRAGR